MSVPAFCPECGHLTAAHGVWPIPVTVAGPVVGRPVCHACRDSGRDCPSTKIALNPKEETPWP
jgi:hypothetical protein